MRYYQSVPALATPLTDREMTELADEEAVKDFARRVQTIRRREPGVRETGEQADTSSV